MHKVAFFIDGWYMRKRIMSSGAFEYTAYNIYRYCKTHLKRFKDYHLVRIFYYDTMPLKLKGHNPISKKCVDFSTTEVAKHQTFLLNEIKKTPNMALRLGRSIWRNTAWVLNQETMKALISKKITVDDLVPTDVMPQIEQKAVDMKMGIDITSYALKRLADTIVVISGDSDLVPALKLARREGIVVILDPLRGQINDDLREHADHLNTCFKEGGKMWWTVPSE